MEVNQQLFKLVSILLQYPEEYLSSLNLIKTEIANVTVAAPEIEEEFANFLTYMQMTPSEKQCENYVTTFDFNDKTSLYLTYSTYGDKRERGPALVKIKEVYTKAGLQVDDSELPDYFPLMLEFAAAVAPQFAIELLSEHKDELKRIEQELVSMKSPFFPLFKISLYAMNEYIEQYRAS